MHFEDALAALPLEEPYRFVEKVLECDGLMIRTEMVFTLDHPIIRGHRKVGGLVPGSILMEQAAQTAWLLAKLREDQDDYGMLVVGALQGKFSAPIRAPARVECRVHVPFAQGNNIGFAAELSITGETVAKVKGTCHRAPRRSNA